MKNILIVEDEKTLMTAIDDKLTRAGHKTKKAETIDQAIHILQSGTPIDAIWLDHYLPGKNGTELVAFMKKKTSPFQDIPIFLVSNTASAEKVYNYISMGVNKYFVKAEKKLTEIIADIEARLAS